MDYRLYRWVNGIDRHHKWLPHTFNVVESVGVVVIAVAAFGLWLLARPGGSTRWKLASASALAAAGLGLLINRLIAHGWDRARPYETHHGAYTLSHSHDPSFPSDHASAAFGIAFAVLLFDRVAGGLFLALAVLIGIGRVVIGAHYPGDVLAGLAVGLASALIVVLVARPVIAFLVRVVQRVTDPVTSIAWRAIARR
jgi:undecaprenyl-diphosphatase